MKHLHVAMFNEERLRSLDYPITNTLPSLQLDWNGDTDTTPITLAYFRVTEAGGYLRFDWATATETGNVGFNLYEKTAQGWRRINDQLITSEVIDSAVPCPSV